jgi:DEAD/DEAH box helicase domain-containing protein
MGSTWTDALEGLLAGEDERLVARVHQPGHPAEQVQVPDDLHPTVVQALKRRGITSLFTHQVEAWDSVMRDGDTIVTTGTASGKSLCFNLPVLHVLAGDPRARALYLYPTKALA